MSFVDQLQSVIAPAVAVAQAADVAVATATQAAQVAQAQVATLQQQVAALKAAIASGVIPIFAGTDLGDVLRSAKPGQRFICDDPATPYAWTDSADMADGVSLVLQGNPVTFLQTKNGSTGANLRGANCELAGFTVAAAFPGLTIAQAYGTKPNIHNIDVQVRVEQGVQLNELATQATVSDLTLRVPTGSRAVYVYGTADFVLQRIINAGSLGEDGIRLSATDGGVRPKRGKILGCDLRTILQAAKNSATISAREGEDIEISGGHLAGWLRAGQASRNTVSGLRINRNRFELDPHLPERYTLIDLMGATLVECDGNIVALDDKQRFLGWDAKVSVPCQPTNTTIILTAPDVKRKKLMIGNDGKGESDGVGTVVKIAA